MALNTSANPADFASRIQTYFNPKLMKALDYALVIAAYGMRQAFPANGLTIRFFRPRAANTTGVGAIAEGVTPATITEVAVGYVDVSLTQRGALSVITDLVQAQDLLNTVQLHVETLGSDAALDLDTVCRNALITSLQGSDATYGANFFERFAGAPNTGVSATDFGTMNALSKANAKMTRARHLANVTQLRVARVPMIGGKYVCLTPPAVIHDIRQDADWVAAATHVNNQALYKRGQIELDGCVFVEHDNPWIEAAVYGTYNAAGENYTVTYLGQGAFGAPELSNKKAGGSPQGPRMTILSSADKSDPLNLKTYIGWKSLYGAKAFITNVAGEVPHYLNFRCKSTYV